MGDEKVKERVLGYLLFDLTHIDMEIVRIYSQFLGAHLKNKLRLRPDLSSESFFYRRLSHQRYLEDPKQILFPKADCAPSSIILSLETLKMRFRGQIVCLDCGSGPSSIFYTKDLEGDIRVEIITVDPLAEVYYEIHKRYNTGYDLVCIRGYGEELIELFPTQRFNLVYSSNAIDHSQDPQKIIENLYVILKPGGHLYLHGFIKEGSAANWLGLHKWNIEVSGDDLLLSNRDGSINKINMTENLKLKVFHRWVEGNNIGDMYSIIYEKIDENSD